MIQKDKYIDIQKYIHFMFKETISDSRLLDAVSSIFKEAMVELFLGLEEQKSRVVLNG